MCRDQCREIIRGTHRLFSRKYMFGVANIAKNFLLSKDDSKLIGDCSIRVLYSNIAKKLLHWHGRAKVLDPVSERNSVFYDHSFCIECFYSRGQQLCKFIEKKTKRLQNQRVRFSQDLFGTPTTPLFHCFGSPIWSPRRTLKALYNRIVHNTSDWLAKCGLSSIEMTRRVWGNPSKHGIIRRAEFALTVKVVLFNQTLSDVHCLVTKSLIPMSPRL